MEMLSLKPIINSVLFSLLGIAILLIGYLIIEKITPENNSNNYVEVKAIWNEPSTWNVWLPIIIIAGVCVGLYFLNVNFEQKRWSESDYSPYDN